MSVESAEHTIDLVAILAIILLLGYGLSTIGSSISDFLRSLFGDKVAKIDPVTGLPIDPRTGQPFYDPAKTAPTPDQAAAIRATFDSTSPGASGTPLDSIDTSDAGVMAGFSA